MLHLLLAWCCDGFSLNLSSESDGISACCPCLWATAYVLSSATCPRENCFLFIQPWLSHLVCTCFVQSNDRLWTNAQSDACLTEIYPQLSFWSPVPSTVKWKQSAVLTGTCWNSQNRGPAARSPVCLCSYVCEVYRGGVRVRSEDGRVSWESCRAKPVRPHFLKIQIPYSYKVSGIW